jgi:hypothetical protein
MPLASGAFYISVKFPQNLQFSFPAHDLEARVILILVGVTLEPGLIPGPLHLYQITMIETTILVQYLFCYLHLFLLLGLRL